MRGAAIALSFALSSLALSLLGGCGRSDNEPGPGGVSVGESRALDEAAEMLEQRRTPPEALGTGSPGTAVPVPPAK